MLIANDILRSPRFDELLRLRTRPYAESIPHKFDPAFVADFFLNSSLVLDLSEYSSPRNIGAAYDEKFPNNVWINTNNDSLGCTCAALLIHAATLALSYHTPAFSFSHDEDGPWANWDTAPYAIQSAVRKQFCKQHVTERTDLVVVATTIK
jgi:hypothetical protein